MTTAAALTNELFRGVLDGRQEAIREAPYLAQEAGLRRPNYRAMAQPIAVTPLPPPTLGVTYIDRHGRALGVKINRYIANMGAWLAARYNKSADWARQWVYERSKLVTEHELGHVLSSDVAAGEGSGETTTDVMESVTTYGLHRVARRLGKHKKAARIKETNPYPVSWRLGELADQYYPGGYPNFMADVQREPFYKPLWRLGKAAAKAGASNIGDRIAGRNLEALPAGA